MEGYGEIGEIKKKSEQLGEEAKLKASIEQQQEEKAKETVLQDLALPERISQGEMLKEEAKDALIKSLDDGQFALEEGLELKKAKDSEAEEYVELHKNKEAKAAPGGAPEIIPPREILKEKANEAVKDKLDEKFQAMPEGLQIKQAGAGQQERQEPEQERKKAIRDSFRKYVRMIRDNNIPRLLRVTGEDIKKGSVSYKQLREAAENVQNLYERLGVHYDDEITDDDMDNPVANPATEAELIEAMTRLSETARIYYDLHRGHQWTDRGESHKEASNKLKTITKLFFQDISVKVLADEPEENRPPVEADKKAREKAKSRLEELVKYYKKWGKHFGYNEADERANIKAKRDLFSVYEHEMDVYKAAYRDNPEGMAEDIAAMIKEADYYKVQDKVLYVLERDGLSEGDSIHKMAQDHGNIYDYKEGEEELTAKEVDADLSEDKLAAIEKIDRWFIRNYNNGGIVGRPINIKNHHGEIVSELMRRTKRERLFIYYLIETGARKDPKVFDAYASQTEYIPNFDKIKKQMIASKLKVMSRLVGGYVYMNKLSEAMFVDDKYKELIKDNAKITRFTKEDRDAEQSNDPVIKRAAALKRAYESMEAYKEKAELVRKADKSQKAALEGEADRAWTKAQQDLQALIAADNAVGEASGHYGQIGTKGQKSGDRIHNRQDSNKTDFKDNTDAYTSGAAAGAEKFAMASGWFLSDSKLPKIYEYARGYTSSSIAVVGHALAMLYGIYNLTMNGGKMHAGDIGKEIAGILKSGTETYVSYRSGVELVDKYAGMIINDDFEFKEAKVSKGLKIATIATSGTAVMMNAYDIMSAGLDYRNANKASNYLDAKFRVKQDQFEAPPNETEEQKKARLQNIKEERYEQNMIELSKELSKHKMIFGASEMAMNAATVVSVVLPGLGGTIAATIGFVGGITVSIIKAVHMGNIRERLFDKYFHFEEFMGKVNAKMTEKHRTIYDEDEFRKRMRRKLAAAAGFADMVVAADQITRRYADQVYDKLFGENPAAGDEREGYVQLVKSFGLKYDEKKKKPDVMLIVRKMTGR